MAHATPLRAPCGTGLRMARASHSDGQEASRELLAELEALFEGCPHGVLALWRGNIVYANRGARLVEGEPLVGSALQPRVVDPPGWDPSGPPPARLRRVTVRWGGGEQTFSVGQLDAGGSRLTLLRSLLPGTAQGMTQVLMASQRGAEGAPLWTLLHASNLGVWVGDALHRTVMANEALYALVGASRADLFARSLHQVLGLDPELALRGTHIVKRVTSTGNPVFLELTFGVHAPGDRAALRVALVRDVTSQGLVVDELKRRAADGRALVDLAPVAAVMVDAATGSIRDASPFAEQWLGLARPGRRPEPRTLASVLGGQAALDGMLSAVRSMGRWELRGAPLLLPDGRVVPGMARASLQPGSSGVALVLAPAPAGSGTDETTGLLLLGLGNDLQASLAAVHAHAAEASKEPLARAAARTAGVLETLRLLADPTLGSLPAPVRLADEAARALKRIAPAVGSAAAGVTLAADLPEVPGNTVHVRLALDGVLHAVLVQRAVGPVEVSALEQGLQVDAPQMPVPRGWDTLLSRPDAATVSLPGGWHLLVAHHAAQAMGGAVEVSGLPPSGTRVTLKMAPGS